MDAGILLIEDSDDFRDFFAEVLRYSGFNVVETALASTGLGLLQNWTPDLIVLDLGMPPGEMGGIEFLARIREDRRWATLPVVILSGIGELINPDVIAGLRVDAAIGKGRMTADEIVVVIKRILRDRGASGGRPT